MAKRRFQKLEPEKREAILRAAAEEFSARGYRAASVNRIIERSGMSKGAVYYYFEDKADLFATALEHSVQRIMEEVGWPALEVLGPEEFWNALLELTRRSVDYARRDDWWMRLGLSLFRLQEEPEAQAAVGRVLDLSREWWRAIIGHGQELGLVRTDLPLDLLVEIAIGADQGGDRWMMERWETLPEEELRRIVDARVDLLRDMLSKKNEGWEE